MTKTLDQVQDPELAIPITDLGLIYAVREKSGKVDIKMTLTSM
ncbi:MAG: iron-sulfur cluster assembly protein, partial [Candidatus Paceibacterota bacterium]